eukprot:m.261471 g.261471  ORF g.261471 m.261471 type:complete len:275 (-) comp42187_c0_seq1:294-1118(-)
METTLSSESLSRLPSALTVHPHLPEVTINCNSTGANLKQKKHKQKKHRFAEVEVESFATSQVSLHSTKHSRQRGIERNTPKELLQHTKKHAPEFCWERFRKSNGGGMTWRVEWDGIVLITNNDKNVVVTSYPSSASKEFQQAKDEPGWVEETLGSFDVLLKAHTLSPDNNNGFSEEVILVANQFKTQLLTSFKSRGMLLKLGTRCSLKKSRIFSTVRRDKTPEYNKLHLRTHRHREDFSAVHDLKLNVLQLDACGPDRKSSKTKFKFDLSLHPY